MQEFKKIRLFNKVSFSFARNKFIFSDPSFGDNHLTFHLGGPSGTIDFHLTKNVSDTHFMLFKVSYIDMLNALPTLLPQIVGAIFGGSKEVDQEFLVEHGYKIFKYSDVNLDNYDLNKLKKKKALNLDPETEEFSDFQQVLSDNFEIPEVTISELESSENFNGYISNSDSNIMVMKSNLTNYKLMSFQEINLDIPTILTNTFGQDGYETINSKLTEGINYLETNSDSNEEDWLTLTVKNKAP